MLPGNDHTATQDPIIEHARQLYRALGPRSPQRAYVEELVAEIRRLREATPAPAVKVLTGTRAINATLQCQRKGAR